MDKVYIRTQAYNAEKTIRRTVDSVLNQTYSGELLYYILDNGSTDGTLNILKEYASRDSRVIVEHIDKNYSPESEREIEIFTRYRHYRWEQFDFDYLCVLDADDEYTPDFLQKMVDFIVKNEIDIAVCGSQFISEQTGEPMNRSYSIPRDMIISGRNFEKYFTTYLQFMWTTWGKLYSASVLKRAYSEAMDKVSYGADTICCMNMFRHAKRVGILGGALHKYYISTKSVSYKFNEKRVVSDQIAFDEYLRYLNSRNAMTRKNLDYIYDVYSNSVKNTIAVTLNSQTDPLHKLNAIRDVFAHRHTQDMLHRDNISDSYKKWLQIEIIMNVLRLSKACDEIALDVAADILAALDYKDSLAERARLNGWRSDEVFLLLLKIKGKLADVSAIEDINIQLNEVMANSPLLTDIDVDAAAFLRETIAVALQDDIPKALDEIFKLLDDEIPDIYAESYMTLGEVVSASAEYADGWIFFKKMRASYLIGQGQLDEAAEKLSELEELLPGDEEIAALKDELARLQ